MTSFISTEYVSKSKLYVNLLLKPLILNFYEIKTNEFNKSGVYFGHV